MLESQRIVCEVQLSKENRTAQTVPTCESSSHFLKSLFRQFRAIEFYIGLESGF